LAMCRLAMVADPATVNEPAPPPAAPRPPPVLAFTGLNVPIAVAVDTAGSVYVTDFSNNWVLKLSAQ
jgi:hypothetical protein